MSEPLKHIGRYAIRRALGRGAMGLVFEAWDPQLERCIALKTMQRDALGAVPSDELRDRFRREAETAAQLHHPNIVAAYEYGEDADTGTAFIAMEYIEGEELKCAFERNEHFPLPEVGRIMAQLLAALAQAHAHGVVHRDIKPGNIFRLADGQIKVGDFGIARIDSSDLTQVGSVLGTPSYMSPEQFMGQTVDGRADLYAAGVILYQFLTGGKPFTGKLAAIMRQVLSDEPSAPSTRNPGLPPACDALIRKALAKRPADRFQDADAFATALHAALSSAAAAPTAVGTTTGEPAGTATGEGGTAARPPGDPAHAPGAPQAPTAEARRPRRAATALSVAILIALGLAAAAVYFRQRPAALPTGEKSQRTAIGAVFLLTPNRAEKKTTRPPSPNAAPNAAPILL